MAIFNIYKLVGTIENTIKVIIIKNKGGIPFGRD